MNSQEWQSVILCFFNSLFMMRQWHFHWESPAKTKEFPSVSASSCVPDCSRNFFCSQNMNTVKRFGRLQDLDFEDTRIAIVSTLCREFSEKRACKWASRLFMKNNGFKTFKWGLLCTKKKRFLSLLNGIRFFLLYIWHTPSLHTKSKMLRKQILNAWEKKIFISIRLKSMKIFVFWTLCEEIFLRVFLTFEHICLKN